MVKALVEDFIAQAAGSGAEVRRCAGVEEARAFISQFLQESGRRKLIIAPDVRDFVPGNGHWPVFEPAKKVQYLEAEAGLVLADYGIAATGTVVHLDRNEQEKIVWTLPEVCICVLAAERIVAGQEELAEVFSGHLLSEMHESPQVSLITGPSRTADIEGQLTLGVQGPKRLIILIIKGGRLSDL